MITKLDFPIRVVDSYAMLYPLTSTPLAAIQATGVGLAIPDSMDYCCQFVAGAERCAVTFIRQHNLDNIEYLVSLFGTSSKYTGEVLEALVKISRPSALLVHEEKKYELISALCLN